MTEVLQKPMAGMTTRRRRMRTVVLAPRPGVGVMNMHRLAIVVVVAVLGGMPHLAAQQNGYDLFQKALAAERADGNLRQAIQLYERVVKEAAGDRALVARALVRMAECHEKLGQRDAARIYERVVRDFADQADSVTAARARLAVLQSPVAQTAQTVREIWSGTDVDPMGGPSPDGRYLSFTDWDTGDLAVRDLIDGRNRRLTNTGGWEVSGDYAEYSVISPDGRQVAYAWFTDKGGRPDATCACRYDVRVLPLPAADARPRVVHQSDETVWARPVAWAPDGRRLFIVRELRDGTNQLAVVTLSDGSLRVLKSLDWRYPDRMAASPDGRFVAFDAPAESDDLTRDIYVLAVDGSRETTVVRHPAHDHAPVWSWDGSHLLFVSDRSGSEAVWRVPVDDGKATASPILVMRAGRPGMVLLGMTRPGSLYFWSGGPGQNVHVADLDSTLTATSGATVLIERFIGMNRAPAWSPDGETLAYLSQRGSSDTAGSTALVLHSVRSRQDREVPMRIRAADRVSWFPDGRSVLVATLHEQRRFAYYRVDITTGAADLVMVTKGNGIPVRRPQVSPDGRFVFHVDRERAAGAEESLLMRFDLQTREPLELKRLTGTDQYFTSFAVSPDGAEVAYLRFDGPPRASILEVIPAAGGRAREVYRASPWLGGDRYSGIAWSLDSSHLLFVRSLNGTTPPFALWKVAATGGVPRPTGLTMPRGMNLPAVHPRGDRIAVAATAEGPGPSVWAIEHFLPRSVATR